jgi:hypothetical protein
MYQHQQASPEKFTKTAAEKEKVLGRKRGRWWVFQKCQLATYYVLCT